MAKRVYLWTGSAAVATIVGLFVVLQTLGLVITSDDVVSCDGNICESVITIRNPTSNDVDIYNKLQVQLDFTPKVKWYEFMVEDGGCKLKKDGSLSVSSTGVACGKVGWRWLNFTDETKPVKDRVYVWRFAKYSTKKYLLRGEKESLFDKVKWGMNIGNDSLDPLWETENHYKGDVQDGKGGAYFAVKDVANLSINKYFATSGERITFNYEPFTLLKSKTATLSVETSKVNLESVSFINGTKLVNETYYKTELVNVTDKNGTYAVNSTLPFIRVVSVPVYVPVNTHTFSYDDEDWTGFDLMEAGNYSFILKTKRFGEVINYSYMLNDRVYYLKFHPLLDDGLVYYWDFEGDYVDIYGDRDFYPTGTGYSFQSVGRLNGQYWNATYGGNDEVTAFIQTTANASWTISWWEKMDSAVANGGILNQYQSGGDDGFILRQAASNNLWTDGIWGAYAQFNEVRNWSNFILVRNSSGFTMFINGSKILNQATGTIGINKNLTFFCGQVGGACNAVTGAESGLNAGLDEVGVWNRAFDQSDVTNSYYNGTNRTFCTGDPCSFAPVAADVGAEPLRPANITFPIAGISTNRTNINFSGIGNFTLYIYRNGTFVQNVSSNTTQNLTYPEGEYLMNFSVSNSTHWYANQSINYTIDNLTPTTDFVANTPANGASSTANSVIVNVTTNDGTETSAFIDFDNSLLGWWRFEDSGTSEANDTSSYGSHGDLVNFGCLNADCNSSSGWTSAGKRGRALRFDGVKDYVNLSNSSFRFTHASNFTLEAWIKTTGLAFNTQQIIGKHGDVSPELQYSLGVNLNGSQQFWMARAATASNIVTNTDAINDTWTHMVGVADGVNIRLYVNGVLKGTTAISISGTSVANEALLIGWNVGATYFNGSIDEVKVWNRALSIQEVNASFNNGRYRLEKTFDSLTPGSHSFAGYVVDSAGNLNSTGLRTYTVLGIGKNWWDGRFGRRINFTLKEENGSNREYEPVEVNVTGLAGSITSCAREIRIVYNGSQTKPNVQFEVPSQVMLANEADGWCSVLFQANVTANDVVQYFAYYNYSEPYFPDYLSQSTFRFNPSDQQYCNFITGVQETVQINWKGTNSSAEADNALCFMLNDSFVLSRKEQWHYDVGFIAANLNMLSAPTTSINSFPFPLFSFIDASNNYLMSNITKNDSLFKEFWIRYPGSATAIPNKYTQLFVTIYDKWPLVKLQFFNTTDAPQFTSFQFANYTWYDASGINRTNKSTEPNTPQINELEPWFGISRYEVGQGTELSIIQYNGSAQTVGLNYTKHNIGSETSNIVGINVTQNGTFWLGFFYNAKNVGDSPSRKFYEMMQHPLRPRFGNIELVPEVTTTLALYLDNFSIDKLYEYQTTASLSVAFQGSVANFTINSTGNLTVCYDIQTGEFGINYVCGNITSPVRLNLTILSENYFGNNTANSTAMNRSNNGRYNTTIDNRTILKSFVFNITGFASGGDYPENISFNILVNRTEASLPGKLVGKDLFENKFIVGGSTQTIRNITYAQASSEKIFLNISTVGVSQLQASTGSKNLSLNFSFNLSGFIVDANVSFKITDNLSTNAYINYTSSYNATTNSTTANNANGSISAWENFASNFTAAGISRWTYQSLSGNGMQVQEYRGSTGYGASVDRFNITLLSSLGDDGSLRYYENEFDIRNLSRIDIDWFQLTSCGTTSGSCSATTRIIVFDGTVQATLRDYTSSCGPCFFSVAYGVDENISLRKVDDSTFDVYVNDVFFQTVGLGSLDASKPWRLGFYGDESGTGGFEMDLHKISLNAIMAARSGPWNNRFNKSLSVMSKPVDLVAENVTAASLDAVDLTIENFGQVNRTFELSNNNGKNWLVVSLGSRRVFDSLGSDIVWRVNCTAKDVRDTCMISKLIVTVNPGQVNNITIDYGDDGTADFFFRGILNSTNSPIKVTNDSFPIWTYAKNNCLGALTCAVPIKITAGSEGIIQISNVNRTQIVSNITLNKTLFETTTQLFWNATFINGIVMLDDLKARYAGSRNFSIFAHFDGSGGFLKSDNSRMMNVVASWFNETLPRLISQFEIIPKTVNDKNLTPYGQNSTRPFLNITANAYDLPLNWSIALNQTPPSCIAVRVYNTSSFANGNPLNTTRMWNRFSISPGNTRGAWFQVDLNNCNASSLFNFNFEYLTKSVCSECVHTGDLDS